MQNRFLKYVEICERAEKLGICNRDRMDSLMDIESSR